MSTANNEEIHEGETGVVENETPQYEAELTYEQHAENAKKSFANMTLAVRKSVIKIFHKELICE